LVQDEGRNPVSTDSYPYPTFTTPPKSDTYDLAAKAALIEKEGFRPFDGNPLRTAEEEAKARVEIIIANAEANAHEISEEARREGFACGEKEGREAGREVFLQASSAFQSGLEQLEHLRQDIMRKNEEHLVAVAVAAAERVIHREIQCDPAIVVNIVQAALGAAAELDSVTLALHPDDLSLVQEEAEDLTAKFDHVRTFKFVAEAGVERGGCIVRTPCGDVEGRIPLQFEAVVEAIRSSFPKELKADG
jgi:flagellar biosynthesis/type III secretory pathway protein FliH